MEYVDRAAFAQGLAKGNVQQNISNKGADLQQSGQQMQQDNRNQRNAVEWHNNTLEQGLQKRADTYEEDRIGQGNLIGKNLGIGGDNKAERLLKNYQGNQQKGINLTNKKK